MSERRYDEREVARILEGAASQERALVRANPQGLTLAELEQAAAEAGLDPAMVRQSAAALDAPRDAKVVVVERVIPAGALPPTAALLAAVRAAVGPGGVGSAAEGGETFAWRGQLDGQQAEVTVAPTGGRSVVRVRVALDAVAQASHARWTLGVGGGAGVVAFAALVGAVGALAALPAAALVGAGYAMARRDVARRAANVRARAEAVADAVARAG